MNPKDTRTPAQKATMERLTREAIARYGLTLVSGHHDYAAKACPCFPAREEYAPLLKGGASLPSATRGAITAIGSGTVTASSLRLRRTPDGEQIGSMPRGTALLIFGSDGEWLNVQTPAGYRGWAHRDHVRADAAAEPDEDIEAEISERSIEARVALLESSVASIIDRLAHS